MLQQNFYTNRDIQLEPQPSDFLDEDEEILDLEGLIGQTLLEIENKLAEAYEASTSPDIATELLQLEKYIDSYDESDVSGVLLSEDYLGLDSKVYLESRVLSSLANIQHFLSIVDHLSGDAHTMLVSTMLHQLDALVQKVQSKFWNELKDSKLHVLAELNLHDLLYRCAEITRKYAQSVELEFPQSPDSEEILGPDLDIALTECWVLAADLYTQSLVAFRDFNENQPFSDQPLDVWKNEQMLEETLLWITIIGYGKLTNQTPEVRKGIFLDITYRSVRLLQLYKQNTVNSANDPLVLARINYNISLGCKYADEMPTCGKYAEAALDYYYFIAPQLRKLFPVIEVMVGMHQDAAGYIESHIDLARKDCEKIAQLVKMAEEAPDLPAGNIELVFV